MLAYPSADARTFSSRDWDACCIARHGRAQAEQMADRVDQIGAVHGVEVKIGDAVIDEIEHLLGGDRGGDQLARRRIVVEAVEALARASPAPTRRQRAAKFFVCLKFCTGRMPGTIGISMPLARTRSR